MLRSFLAALVLWALLFSGTCCRSAKVQSPQPRDMEQTTGTPLTLTNERPTGSFPVRPETLASAPSILEVSITKVVNPAATPVAMFVYLLPAAKKGKAEPERVLVGNFSLYPPDQPGKFLLGLSNALEKLEGKNSASKSGEFQLVVEMQRLDDTRPWTEVEVTIDPPKWLRDEPK